MITEGLEQVGFVEAIGDASICLYTRKDQLGYFIWSSICLYYVVGLEFLLFWTAFGDHHGKLPVVLKTDFLYPVSDEGWVLNGEIIEQVGKCFLSEQH